jgi:hypothetical protein
MGLVQGTNMWPHACSHIWYFGAYASFSPTVVDTVLLCAPLLGFTSWFFYIFIRPDGDMVPTKQQHRLCPSWHCLEEKKVLLPHVESPYGPLILLSMQHCVPLYCERDTIPHDVILLICGPQLAYNTRLGDCLGAG